MREVISKLLWIGNARDSRDIRGVLKLGIQVVIDLALEEPPISYPREIIYCRFPLLDGTGNAPALLQSAIATTTNFITAQLPTLVACSGGMSRSPAVAAAGLARAEGLDLDLALERITSSGPCDLSPTLWNDIRNLHRKTESNG